MEAKIPIYKQPKKSVLCGPYCLKMLYEYHGKKMSIKEIIKTVKMKKIGTYTSELGYSAIKNNFDAKIMSSNTYFYPPQYKKYSQKKILEDLKKRLKNKKKKGFQSNKDSIKSSVKFMEVGGKLIIRIPKISDLKTNLKKGYSIILCIDRKSLYGKKLGPCGHFVILTGIKGKNAILNDPHPIYGGIKKYNIDDLIYSWYSWGGGALLLKPKK